METTRVEKIPVSIMIDTSLLAGGKETGTTHAVTAEGQNEH